ncbi:hypothetical protein BN903_187 [Halorubrum sp. AJ67]|nr:hypothetical protein BN903_187 [Halorubrum sp. AJ67]
MTNGRNIAVIGRRPSPRNCELTIRTRFYVTSHCLTVDLLQIN